MPNEELADELDALNSIYGDATIIPSPSDPSGTYILQPPSSIISPQLKLTFSFPDTYPDAPPVILEDGGTGVDLAKEMLKGSWRQGEVCLYDLVEGLREMLAFEEEEAVLEAEPEEPKPEPEPEQEREVVVHHHEEEHEQPIDVSVPKHPWTVTEPIVEKKSVFVARAIAVNSADDAKRFLADLIAGDKKIARATHNIFAYRIKNPTTGVIYQDNEDDGETAAGSRMAHLLQLMDVWNVLVVVTRWYGHVKLGPDRFRIINIAARDALVKGGFVKEETGEKGKGKGGKKGKK
ncbi:hypothetical protein RUND412_001713 [Rhizina undulata]